MEIVADSGGIYGLYDNRDPAHSGLRRAIEVERGRVVIPEITLGEIDYLFRSRLGNRALLRFLDDVNSGAFRIESVTPQDLIRCGELITRYQDADLGLSDAAVAVTADRLGTNRILTVDVRDFRLVRSARGKPFRLLPADLA
ncbi:MAG: PIN domain-containing protein [Acidobacteriota bacterium]